MPEMTKFSHPSLGVFSPTATSGWVMHVGEVLCYLKWQRTGSNYKLKEKSKLG